jgi:hypothetical protein
MRFILLSLLVLVNSYTLLIHKYNSLLIIKSKCFSDEYIYLKNKIKRFEKIKRKMMILTDQNLKTIKEIVDEEYSTEWDFYNKSWVIKN